MLYIRTDANSSIGTGHVMRCLAIAKALRKKGLQCTFITADREPEQLILSMGYPVLCLNSSWKQLEEEIEPMKNLIQDRGITELLIDSYQITKDYMFHLKKLTRIIYMDDLNQMMYPADVIINYNIYAKRVPYDIQYCGQNIKFLLGCDYVPLREEFKRETIVVKNTVSDILITTGGTDPYFVVENVLKKLLHHEIYQMIQIHVVVGRFYTCKENLRRIAQEHHKIILHESVSEMAKLMKTCDLAISAGGTTLYELCACGTPTVSFSFADNQIQGVKEFDRQGIIPYMGDVRNNLQECVNQIEINLFKLIQSKKWRDKLSKQMQELVDGSGAERIVEQIYD